jgi:hypothetical protein
MPKQLENSVNQIAVQTQTTNDGWNDADADSGRMIRGQLIRCNDGRWFYSKEGTPVEPGARFLAAGTLATLVRWQNGQPTEVLTKQSGEPLPAVDDLNSQIDESEWELGLDGKPRPPWQAQRLVYLVNTTTYSKVTFVTSSFGGARAIADLRDAIETRRRLYGDGAVPVVEPVSTPWKTRFGVKVRPAFKIVGWIGATTQAQVGITPMQTQIEAKPAAASTAIKEFVAPKKLVAADLDDEIPY